MISSMLLDEILSIAMCWMYGLKLEALNSLMFLRLTEPLWYYRLIHVGLKPTYITRRSMAGIDRIADELDAETSRLSKRRPF